MTIKDKLLIYVYRKGSELEQEIDSVNIHSRHMPLDSIEHFEAMNTKMRVTAWKEFLDDLYRIIINCK